VICEPLLQERIERAKERANCILSGTEATEEAINLHFRFYLSKRLHIGIFDEYFDARTLDELALEYFLWIGLEERNSPDYQKDQYVKQMAEATKGVGSLFGDEKWEEVKLDQDFLDTAKQEFKKRSANAQEG
jgi:hypothetical protein